jgi:DNA-directed RNA polymerase sigma subunit (sigma70/sigma32)
MTTKLAPTRGARPPERGIHASSSPGPGVAPAPISPTALSPSTRRLLEAREPSELFARWQRHGDTVAREQLLARFMPLARKLARRYVGANEPFEDLAQVASVGLLHAIDRFDYSRGTAFSSFAVPTILGELRR